VHQVEFYPSHSLNDGMEEEGDPILEGRLWFALVLVVLRKHLFESA